MKQKLEAAANVTVIVVGVMLAFLLVRNYLSPSRAATQDLHPIKPGTRLIVKGVGWQGSERTLVLALRVGCRFCMESMPFYGRLNEMEKNGEIRAKVIAVFPNDLQPAEAMLKSEGLSFGAIAHVDLRSLGVPGTPAAIVVDARGRVLKSWLGVLSPAAQKDLISTLEAPQFNLLRPQRPLAENRSKKGLALSFIRL